jgi:hypothetical protein
MIATDQANRVQQCALFLFMPIAGQKQAIRSRFIAKMISYTISTNNAPQSHEKAL